MNGLNACFTVTLIIAYAWPSFAQEDAAQAAKDEQTIELLSRLKNIDVDANPKYKAVVLRYLGRNKGTPQYIEIVERFKISGVESDLLQMAIANPDSSTGVNAARLLLESGATDTIISAINSTDAKTGLATIKAVGAVGSKAAIDLIRPLITSSKSSTALQNEAVRAVGKSRRGQMYLLKLVEDKQMPSELSFSFADALLGSRDARIVETAKKHLQLPETAGATPLPPVAQLATMQGKAEIGRTIYATKGTCANCHKVMGNGKDVGPDLSEIGDKLSREAMFVSILNPSEGISHNYETFYVELESGLSQTGLLVSETDTEVTIKNAEGVIRKFSRDEIVEFEKDNVSLMPAGLQKLITVDELVSLVDYLQTLRKKE